MSIQDHYLDEDLIQLNEELLKFHNASLSALKDAQEGKVENMTDYQWEIERSIEVIIALHNKKKTRQEREMLISLYNYRR